MDCSLFTPACIPMGLRGECPLRSSQALRVGGALGISTLCNPSIGKGYPAMAPAPRNSYIKTYGCQMNVYDSERMAEALGGVGYDPDQNARTRRI